MKHFRTIFGAVIWIVIVGLVWWNRDSIVSGQARQTIAALGQLVADRQPTARIQLSTDVEVEIGDPIFVQDAHGELIHVGEIHSILDGQVVSHHRRARASSVQLLFYPTTPQYSADATITYYTTPDSLAWVVGTLLTPERKALVMQEIRSAYQQYHAELWASLQPVLEGTLGDGWVVIEQDLPAAIRRRGPQLEALGTRYEEEILNEELLPLAKREIWPIVQQHAEPVMETIGLELWERVSLWRFGWRAAYDRSPLPDRNLVEHEWQRFVRVEALPILSKHSGEMIEVVRSVIQDASRNEAVQAGIRDSLSRVATDPEFQQLVYDIFEEVFILNPRLREVLQRRWTGPESQQALQLVSDRLEPTIRRVGDLLFGTFDQGITPEFASVLRTTILAKDQRWFLLEPNPGGKPLGRGQPVFTAQLASERRVKPTSSPQATPTAPPGIRGKQASGGG